MLSTFLFLLATSRVTQSTTYRENSTAVLANGSTDKQRSSHTWKLLSTTGSSDLDAEARRGKASLTFWAMDRLWKSKIISRATKVKILNSNVKAVLLHTSESWTITQTKYQQVASLIIIQQMQDCTYTLARQNSEQNTVKENWQKISAGANEKKKIKLGWSHIEKS